MLSKLIASSLLALGAAALLAQSPALPPIKMGLWESTVTAGPGKGMKSQTCITPASYQAAFAHMPKGCAISNLKQSSAHLSADISCTIGNVHETGHFDVEFPNAETNHALVNMSIVTSDRTIPITVRSDGRFVSADCGGLAPGTAKMVH